MEFDYPVGLEETMIKSVLFVLLQISSNQVFASGCGSYDFWLTTGAPTVHRKYESKEFDIISYNKTFIRVRFKDEPEKTWTLPLEARIPNDTGSDKPYEAFKEDISFEEGNGCGPVYRCTTGRIRVVMPMDFIYWQKNVSVFAWPVLIPYRDYEGRSQAATDLLPTFALPAQTGSDLPQCSYGDW